MIQFEDRIDAAEQLAKRVEESLDKNVGKWRREPEQRKQQQTSNDYDVIILAIPRGGVIIGDVLSSMLGAKLDIIVSKKIGAPSNSELAIGAVMQDGSYVLNKDIVGMLNVPPSYITEQANILKKEIERRLQSFRGEREEHSSYYNDYDRFEGKIVIIVDDGIATGATMLSAARWLKTKQNCCKMLIIAVPVAPPPSPSLQSSSSNEDVVSKLNQIADKVIILYRPEPFYSVGQFYKQFEQVSDAEVREIMIRHGYGPL
jgi:putative phosphoribosyl transferase